MHKPTPSTIPICPTIFSVNDVQDSDPLHSTIAELSYSNNPLLALQPQSQAYQYMDHLRALDSYRPNNRRLKPPDYLSQVVTPLKLEAWAQALAQHPDHAFRSYVLQGIAQGFRIGFNYNAIATRSATSNMPSAYANPQPVSDYMETEIQAGRVIGPLRSDVAQSIQISRFGVIPKRNKPGRWRLILDLSSPPGYSVNDGISSDLCSLSFPTVDDAAQKISQLGANSLIAKIDIARAYRNIPVHPEDRFLLGMSWNGEVYIDAALPFGLRSAPKIFTAVGDALAWVLKAQGVTWLLKYIDDILTIVPPGSSTCAHNLDIIIQVCDMLGVPLAREKVEGPSTCLPFLGIELDTCLMEMRLPQEKLERLKATVAEWIPKKAATKRQLQSLIGQLVHAAKVVIPGRIFLRRMIDLSTRPKQPNH